MENEAPRKIAVHIQMTPRQIRVVSREAKRQDITLPEFVRRIIDHYIDHQRLDRVDLRA